MPEPRIERECLLRCDRCNAAPYVIFRQQVVRADGSINEDVWEHGIWPGEPGVPPLVNRADPRCPRCTSPLRRVAA